MNRGCWTAVLAATAMLAFAACDSETSGTPCDGDEACATGQVCSSGTCSVVTCNSAGDCLSFDQICIEVADQDQKVCSGRECSSEDPCPSGEICNLGQCVPDATGGDCTTDEECGEGQVCDDDVCRACEGEECEDAGEDCTPGDCGEGETCNEETGVCEGTGVGEGTPCQACDEEGAGCPEGWECKGLASGDACLPPCTSNDDCETGWTCQGDPAACTPAGTRCGGCMLDGCADGQVCDTSAGDTNGECAAPLGSCETCEEDWQCGPDAACINQGQGVSVCMLRCGGDRPECPASATCQVDEGSERSVCKAQGGACCYDDDPSACEVSDCDPPCQGATPICLADGGSGVCVECSSDADCDGDATCHATGYCQSQECEGATPAFFEGECVECVDNSHCDGDLTCKLDKTCGEATPCEPACDPEGSYPHCVEIPVEGELEPHCVPCTTDGHCNDGCTCNTDYYICEGNCTAVGEEQCHTDEDCDPESTGFTLKCDEQTNLCYDVDGGCDGVVAHCKGGGKCLTFLEAFLGTDGGLPGFELPDDGQGGGGPATLAGSCECNPILELAGETDVCGGNLCFGFASLIEALSGGGGTGGGQQLPGADVCFAFDSGP